MRNYKEWIVEQDGIKIPLVDARDVWEELDAKRDYLPWIKSRITRYHWKGNRDYYIFDKDVEYSTEEKSKRHKRGVKYLVPYYICQSLGLMQHNEKGEAVRQQFINKDLESKKKALEDHNEITRLKQQIEQQGTQQVQQNPAPKDIKVDGRVVPTEYYSALEALVQTERMRIEAERRKTQAEDSFLASEKRLKEQKPAADFGKAVMDSDGLYSTTEIAKGLGMSAVTFNKWLHKKGVIFLKGGVGPWVLYAKYQNLGYHKMTQEPVYLPDGRVKRFRSLMKYYPKGMAFLIGFWNDHKHDGDGYSSDLRYLN